MALGERSLLWVKHVRLGALISVSHRLTCGHIRSHCSSVPKVPTARHAVHGAVRRRTVGTGQSLRGRIPRVVDDGCDERHPEVTPLGLPQPVDGALRFMPHVPAKHRAGNKT